MRRRRTEDELPTPLDVFLERLRAREAAIGWPIRTRSGVLLGPFPTPQPDENRKIAAADLPRPEN